MAYLLPSQAMNVIRGPVAVLESTIHARAISWWERTQCLRWRALFTKPPCRLFKSARHRKHCVLSHQDIALACIVLSNTATGPRITFIACEGSGYAIDTD